MDDYNSLAMTSTEPTVTTNLQSVAFHDTEEDAFVTA